MVAYRIMIPRLMVVAAAILFSTGGAAIKGTSLSGWQTAAFRSLVAAVAMLAGLPAARRGWRRELAPVALAYALTLVLFTHANKTTTSANAIFLQATFPLHILYLAPLMLRERLTRVDLSHALAVALGMALLFISNQSPMATAPAPVLGNILGIASGLTYAATLIGFRWLAHKHSNENPGLPTAVAGNLLAFAFCALKAFPVAATGRDWAVILYLGIIQIGLAYLLLTSALRRVPAFEASALLLVEPVLNPVWTWIIHSENPGAWAIAGGAVIIFSTAARLGYDARHA